MPRHLYDVRSADGDVSGGAGACEGSQQKSSEASSEIIIAHHHISLPVKCHCLPMSLFQAGRGKEKRGGEGVKRWKENEGGDYL